MSNCLACAEYCIKTCPETIEVRAGLTASTSYYWHIKTPKGKVYQRLVDTDVAGKLIIDTSIFPSGSLNPYAGTFELQIRSGTDYLAVIPMTLQGGLFDCVKVDFQDIDDSNPFNVIG